MFDCLALDNEHSLPRLAPKLVSVYVSPSTGNIFHLHIVFVSSKEALAEKDRVIKKMTILTQQNQLLQQSVDDLQKDKDENKAEKNKVGSIYSQWQMF